MYRTIDGKILDGSITLKVAFWLVNGIFSFLLTPLLLALVIETMGRRFIGQSIFYTSITLLFVALTTIVVNFRVRKAWKNTERRLASTDLTNQTGTETGSKQAEIKITIADYLFGTIFALAYWAFMFAMAFYIGFSVFNPGEL